MKPKIYIPFFCFIVFATDVCAQKLYVWCPKDQLITPRKGFLENDTLDVVIFDGRMLTKNSKMECSSEDIISGLGIFIQKTYPGAIVNLLPSANYYKDPLKHHITLKIGISAYHAAFGADIRVGIGSVGGNFSYGIIPEGKWNALTAYAVKVYDYRNGKEDKHVKDIANIDSKSNMWGYATAKNILNMTYLKTNQDMLFFIDESLMK